MIDSNLSAISGQKKHPGKERQVRKTGSRYPLSRKVMTEWILSDPVE